MSSSLDSDAGASDAGDVAERNAAQDNPGGEAAQTAEVGSFLGNQEDPEQAKKDLAKALADAACGGSGGGQSHYLMPGFQSNLCEKLKQYPDSGALRDQALDDALTDLLDRWNNGEFGKDVDKFMAAALRWLGCHMNGGTCTLADLYQP